MKTHILFIATLIALYGTVCLAQGRGACANRSGNSPSNIGGGYGGPGEVASQYNLLANEQRRYYQLQMQQAYLRQQYQQQQEYLKEEQAVAERQRQAQERKLELRKERRLAEIAKREAAKAKRMERPTNTQIAVSTPKTGS